MKFSNFINGNIRERAGELGKILKSSNRRGANIRYSKACMRVSMSAAQIEGYPGGLDPYPFQQMNKSTLFVVTALYQKDVSLR